MNSHQLIFAKICRDRRTLVVFFILVLSSFSYEDEKNQQNITFPRLLSTWRETKMKENVQTNKMSSGVIKKDG